ncbi:MAG TPA: DUF561 domain-containing protein [Stenomitos sp.]
MERPWPPTALSSLGLTHPIVQAPMAGGPTSPELVAAACEAGCMGSLAGAYVAPEALRQAAGEVRRRTERPFAINLFLPEPAQASEEAIARMNARLDAYREPLGLPLSPTPGRYADDFEALIEVVLEVRPAVVSFTFGSPDPALIQRLQGAGIAVMGTATCVREAIALEAVGVDYVVAQGAEAGGHRATFPGAEVDARVGTMALVPQVVDQVGVPVIAAGGIMDGRGIMAALALGAAGVQMGTAFLTADESATHPSHQSAILQSSDESTALTRVFSGRWARGLRNRFMQDLAAEAVLPFPIQNALTRDIRQAAARQGHPELMSLWAGQASALAHEGPVAELVARWAQEASEVALRLCGRP